MFKKGVATLITAVMILPMFGSYSVFAENTVNDAAVSGYVSLTNENGGLELVSENKTPTIYVDSNDFEGVKRAVDDLKEDIKTVTDKTPVVTNEIKKKLLGGYMDGIEVRDDGMSVILTEAVANDAECYIAAYDRTGALASVVKSDRRLNDEHIMDGFDFDTVIKRPAGGKMKAFVWQDMKPLTDVLGLTTATTVALDSVDVVAGTIGESEAVDNLILKNKLNVSEIDGKWESFTIQNVDNTLVIAGSDKRGTIYGIYDLCEKIGVSPWSFWADTVSGHADSLYINLPDGGYTEGEPSVKYRGIFLNDEFNMSEWSKSMDNTGKNMNNATYEKIFELLLRLKANYLWPAMHTYSTAFNVTENNAKLADEYGIVMGSSHAEPLLRNNLGELYDYQEEWKAKPENAGKALNTKTADGKTTIKDDANRTVAYMWTDKDNDGNAVANKEFLTDYWRERAKANSGYENTYTLGMRGVHDGGFSTNMSSQTAMQEILAAQTQILKDEVVKEGQDISDVPQVFIPYKEMLDMYNKGLEIPDYVTLMWPDDNFGYIRQLPTEKERQRSGGAGIYYHLSYFGRPTSYLWLSSTSPALIREEMTKAYDMGAQEIWIANVGDLKPAETEIEYFLDLARDVDTVRNTDVGDWLKTNAKRDFGFDENNAAEYADIKLGYYQNVGSRRPEHFVNGLFSENFGDEGQKLLDSYAVLEKRAEILYNGLSENKKPSFYELLLYPVKGAKNMAEKYVYSDKAKRYAEKGYGAAVNKYAKLSDDAYQRVVDDTKEYTTMLGGKWDKMMNPYQDRLTGSFGGTITGKLGNPAVSELPFTNMEVVPEGNQNYLSFTNYSVEPKFIDIINTGTGSFDWKAETTSECIKLNKTSGTVADNDRIYVSIDQSKVNGSFGGGYIEITRYIGETAVDTQRISVTYFDIEINELPEKTYAESDGYVSIEAEHYTESVKNGEYEWKIEKDFGRSGDSVKAYPDTAKAVSTPNKDNSAYLEYDVYFTSSGTFDIDVYRMPTLNELSGASMRCNIGVDDSAPVRFSGTTKAVDKSTGADSWGKGVLQNTEVLSGKITVPSAGLHKIRLYNESAGVVIDKFVISTGEKKASYFGAPESYNTTYNNEMKPLPAPSVASAEQTGDITPLFEPLAMITDITKEEFEDGEEYYTVPTVALKDFDVGFITFIIASYDKDGNMLDATYSTHGNSMEANECIPFAVGYPSTEGAETIQCMLVKGYVDYETGEIKDKNWENWEVGIISDDNFEPIAPAFEKKVSDNGGISLMASYNDGYVYPATRMNDYIGKESVCVISEKDSTNTSGIKYIRQSTVKSAEYGKIPFAPKGKFDLKIKVAGESGILSEELNTIVNIKPDNDAAENIPVYNQTFAADPSSDSAVTLDGASYDSSKKAVNMGAGGKMTVDFAEPVTMVQGDTVTTSFKIAHAKENNKFMDWAVKNSSGKSIAAIHVSAYNGTSTSHWMSIGDEKVYENTGSLTQAILRTKDGTPGGYTTYTITVNCASGDVTMDISSDNGTESFTGKLPAGTLYDIDKIEFSTDYTNASKSCLVRDISITRSTEASYNITFAPVDKLTEQPIPSAVVTVTDALTGAVIASKNGIYALCKGDYNCTVTADGYKTASGTLELSQATESKTMSVEMEKSGS